MAETSDARSRVVLVTGGTRGIGREVAERLAAQSAAVVINYAGRDDLAEQVVAEIEKAGAKGLALKGDVADENAMSAVFDRVEKEFGGVDVVVHAAGIMPLSPLADLDLEVLDRVLHVNVRGAFVVNQQAVRRVRAGGSIVNVTSSLAKFARLNYAAYAASKAAIDAISLILARELRDRDVTVNSVAPGPVETELFYKGKSQELVDRIRGEVPLGRLGRVEDIAGVVEALVGPARWINGQTIYANGGAI